MFDLYITLRLLYLELRNGFCSVSRLLTSGRRQSELSVWCE